MHGIEVRRADEPIKLATRTLPAGTFIVPVAQPSARLLRNLLDPAIQMDEKFLREQERRRKKRLGDQIYDMTAWSLPMLFDVEVVTSAQATTAKASPVSTATTDMAVAALPAAKVGYLLPWGSGTAAATVEALQAGIKIRTADEAFTHAGRRYPIGTAIIRVSDNQADLAAKLGAIVTRHARRGRADRQQLGGRRHLAGEQPGGVAEGAAGGPCVGYADAEPVRRAGRATCSSGSSARR